MTKILIEGSNKFEISDIEKSEDIPSYTFDTLTKLNHKKDNLYFILGSDTAMNIRTWNNYWRKILENNLQEMYEGNCWGVPSFKLTDKNNKNPFYQWGQDRIWLIEEEIIKRSC